jgi:hypothetical protein
MRRKLRLPYVTWSGKGKQQEVNLQPSVCSHCLLKGQSGAKIREELHNRGGALIHLWKSLVQIQIVNIHKQNLTTFQH